MVAVQLPNLSAWNWPWSALDVLEVLILAFLIYQILFVVKATGAVPLLTWVLVLAAVYFTSEWTGFQAVHWLLGALFPYLVFALIVLYQGEIRRGLARLGRNPFATQYSALQARHVFEDILMAVSRLSSQRIGALIVLEHETSLRTYVESGIPLRAKLSYDLLVTIFQPRAPLHDGAVIVQKDTIAAAACFLPLSVNPIWGTQLGTRHRAAVGITEETDAAAIVVSEETGGISLAVRGAIEIGISGERLAEKLSEIFGHPLPASPVSAAGGPWESSQSHAASENQAVRDRS
jgi:diadenylate cyclase